MDIEEIKNEGIRKHLFESVSAALWNAKCATEFAGETSVAKFPNLKDGLKRARYHLDAAEKLHAELLKYTPKRS